jgi:hypothetical protein
MPEFMKVKDCKGNQIIRGVKILQGSSEKLKIMEVVWVQDGSLAYLRLELA